jgi:HlyD family secretion protein
MTRRQGILIGAAAAAVALGAAGWRWKARSAAPAQRLETAVVERGDVTARVTATGTLSAIVTVQVGSQVSGRIAALHADYNDRVRKGQLIALIDPQLYQAAVAQARANLLAARGNRAKAKAQAVDAERQSARQEALAARKLVAQADADTAGATAEAARASVEAAEGAVAQAQAALEQAEVNLAYTRIYSPTDGVVISRSVDVGQTVAASLQAPTLFVIAENLAKMQVDTSVSEADVGRLRAGMPAAFTVDAYPGEPFRGTVRQVRNAATTTQNVVTYDAVIDVANPELKLKPGMTASVTFVHAEKKDVVKVPNAALRFRPVAGAPGFEQAQGAASSRAAAPPPGGLLGLGGPPPGPGGPPPGAGATAAAAPRAAKSASPVRTVWVVRGGRPAPVQVEIGLSDGSATELVKGELREGDRVVTDASGAPPGGFAASLRRGGL